MRIPYRPYKITSKFGKAVELDDDGKVIKANVTKLVKLKNFFLPERDLKGRVRDQVVQPEALNEDTFAQGKDIADKLIVYKKEGKLWKAAKARLRERFPTLSAP